MKHRLFLTVILGLICFHLYAEDEAPQNKIDVSTLPPVLFDTIFEFDGWWANRLNTTRFLLLDGTNLNYEEMRLRLIAVPGNEKHLRRAKGFEVGGITAAAIALAGFTMALVFDIIPNFPDQNVQKTLTIAGCGVGGLVGLGSVVFFQESHKNLRRATRHYNLAVMGIPIP